MNLNIKKYISLHIILLILIILVAVFFRFYNTPNRYGFDYDPTRDALVIEYGAKTLQFSMIGPPSGIGPFAFGPWYYYQLIIFKILFPFEYSPWIYIGIASTMSVFMMYKIGILLEGKGFGLLVASLAAMSPAETGQIRALSNPTLTSLYAALVIWMFVKFIKENPSLLSALLWGLILGIGINNHYQLLGLLPLPIIVFIFKKEKRWVRIIAFIIGLFVAFLPMLIFNVLHDWSTVKGIIFYITQGSKSIYIPNRWLFYIRDFWQMFSYYVLGISSKVGLPIIIYIGLGFLYLFLKRKISNVFIFLIITFGINFLVLRSFPGQREYYYLLYLHPFIFLFFSLIIWHTFSFRLGKYIGYIILLTVFVGMILQSVERLATRDDQLQFKKEAQAIVKNYSNKKFVVYECSSSQRNRVRGVVFFLNAENKISEDGVKIIFPNDKCLFPENSSSPTIYLQGVDAINISFASESLLLGYGWKKVTPKTVFTQLSQGN